jgi:large subunit ribosomal protein L13
MLKSEENLTKEENKKLQNTSVSSLPEKRNWYFFDLKGKVIGRMAIQISSILRGKGKRDFIPNLDLGDNVVLINSKHLIFTGRKMDRENYYNYSGHPGGMRKRSLRLMSTNYSQELVERIIKGMMPHNKLSRRQIKRLFVYPENEHPHQAQEQNFIKN